MLKAIGKKHRQVREAEEFAAHQYRELQQARTDADELRRKLAATQPAQQVAEVVEPKREAFESDSAYIDAKIQWGVDQGIKRQQEAMAQQAREASMQEQYSKAAKLVPDFEQAVSHNLTWPEGVVDYLQESDMFAELGYHFAKNPSELAKLGEMSKTKRLVALGKIESTLSPFGKSKDEPKAADKPNAETKTPASTTDGITPSKARSDAPVIRPLSSSDGSLVDPDPREMTTREMIQDYQKSKGINLNIRKRH
jgi:hypothetical protein